MADGITITRTFDAPRALVYAAWTTPEQFAIWFGTDAVDIPTESVTMDVRVGGSWTATMHLPDGPTIDWAGEYTEVDPPARLAFTMTDVPQRPGREPITVDLVETADGTRMTMTQSGGHLTEEQYEQTKIGWNGFFDDLAEVLATQQ